MTTKIQMMHHLVGPFYWANRLFIKPGLYFSTKLTGNTRIFPIPSVSEMHTISFPEQSTSFAKNQSEYKPLPAYAHNDPQGTITCAWHLPFLARLHLLFTGRIWHSVWTFHDPLQPQRLSVDKPYMPDEVPDAPPAPPDRKVLKAALEFYAKSWHKDGEPTDWLLDDKGLRAKIVLRLP
jgi:hypothetical protein